MRELEKNEVIELSKKIWEHEDMQKYTQLNFNFYQLKNGEILQFINYKKIPISKTIYYSDEYEEPKVTEDHFINYNMRNFYSEIHEMNIKYDYTKPYLIDNYGRNIASVCTNEYVADYDNNLEWARKKGLFIRFLTDEEIEEYKLIVEDIKKNYIERLKKYYKKYFNKIKTCGYWADR